MGRKYSGIPTYENTINTQDRVSLFIIQAVSVVDNHRSLVLSTMAGYESDPNMIDSGPDSDNNNDVFGNRVQAAVQEAFSMSTFYGSARNLRPRQPVEISQRSSSGSDRHIDSDDSFLDPHHNPEDDRSSSDMFPSEDETPRVVVKRGRPRGSQGAAVRGTVHRGSGT